MPANLVFVIILAITSVITLVVAQMLAKSANPNEQDRFGRTVRTSGATPEVVKVTRYAGLGVGALALLILVTSCFTIVGTKEEGVVTSFGSTQGTLSNGLHVKLPWQKVTEFDAAIQTDTDQYTVRLANGSISTVDASIRWRIVPDSADDLYRDYRDFGNVRDSLVIRQLNAALNEVFASYDPLASLAENSNQDQGRQVEALGQEVEDALRKKVDAQIEVLDVLTPRADFDQSTEDKITQFQQALANTRIATQEKATAVQAAQANKILSNSVSHDPNVLVSKCFDLVKAGASVPPGFSCWPGGSGSVVIPAAGK